MKNTSFLIVASFFATTSASNECGNPVLTSCTYYTDSTCKTENTETTETNKLYRTAALNAQYEQWLNTCAPTIIGDGYAMAICPSGKVEKTFYTDADCRT